MQSLSSSRLFRSECASFRHSFFSDNPQPIASSIKLSLVTWSLAWLRARAMSIPDLGCLGWLIFIVIRSTARCHGASFHRCLSIDRGQSDNMNDNRELFDHLNYPGVTSSHGRIPVNKWNIVKVANWGSDRFVSGWGIESRANHGKLSNQIA